MRRKFRTNEWVQAVALFALVFFGFYFVFSSFETNFGSQDKDGVDILALDRKVDRELNRSMRGIYTKKHLRDLEVSNTNQDLAQKFKGKDKKWKADATQSIEIFDEDLSSSEASLSSISVESQLRSKLDQQQAALEQQKRDKKEYIRKFKENARKDGWIVELNDNLEVISAEPVSM